MCLKEGICSHKSTYGFVGLATERMSFYYGHFAFGGHNSTSKKEGGEE
jgi:hypothetical protein